MNSTKNCVCERNVSTSNDGNGSSSEIAELCSNKCVVVFVKEFQLHHLQTGELFDSINSSECGVKSMHLRSLSSLFNLLVGREQKCEKEEEKESNKTNSSMSCEIFALTNTASLHRAIRHVKAHLSDKYYGVINLCSRERYTNMVDTIENDKVSGTQNNEWKECVHLSEEQNEDVCSELDAVNVSLLLEKANIMYSGCRANTLSYSLDVLLMMIAYASIPLPRYHTIHSSHDVRTVVSSLQLPLAIRNLTPVIERYAAALTITNTKSESEVCNAETMILLQKIESEHGPLMVWEYKDNNSHHSEDKVNGNPCLRMMVDVLVMASPINNESNNYHSNSKNKTNYINDVTSPQYNAQKHTDNVQQSNQEALVWLASRSIDKETISLDKDDENKIRCWAQAFANDVLCHSGYALLTFQGCAKMKMELDNDKNAIVDDKLEWTLINFELNCNIFNLPENITPQIDNEQLCTELMHAVVSQEFVSPFTICLHEDSRKGYHLCAIRNIAPGELVFCDEGRSFAMVTRPHVDKYWSNALKQTFSEYAWPLDSEGHLYAIWEKDPTRWRPINHSCDPSCVFAAPHSLNVIAARFIHAGEDLTMDYATFCDSTMKPFSCLCGSPQCRRYIEVDNKVLEQYGGHAWLRVSGKQQQQHHWQQERQ